jgi:hypothetical protein
MVRGSFFLEEIGFSAINTETASMKASIFGLLLMMWREQTWESGAFERTRGGRRAVTRPSEITRTVTRVKNGFRFLTRFFRNNVFKLRQPIKSLRFSLKYQALFLA